jgi:hypothetical protein
VFHRFILDHRTLRCTPAERSGLIKSAMTVSDIVDLIDARAGPPKARGPYKPRQPKVAAWKPSCRFGRLRPLIGIDSSDEF